MPNYSVSVEDCGTVHKGKSRVDAEKSFDDHVNLSMFGSGPIGHKNVILYQDDVIAKEHTAAKKAALKSNPKPAVKKSASLVSMHESFTKKAPKIEISTRGEYKVDGKPVGRGQKVKSGAWDISVSKNPHDNLAERLAEILIESYDSPKKLKPTKKIVDKIERLSKECSSAEEGAWELTVFLNQNYNQEQIKSMLEAYGKNVIPVSKNPESIGKTSFLKPTESQLRNGIELVCQLDGVTAAKLFATDNGYELESKVYKIRGIKSLKEGREAFINNWHKFIGAGGMGASDIELRNRIAKDMEISNRIDRSRKQKSLASFIKENKTELDLRIKKACPAVKLNDSERELWIRNDARIARWAHACGLEN